MEVVFEEIAAVIRDRGEQEGQQGRGVVAGEIDVHLAELRGVVRSVVRRQFHADEQQLRLARLPVLAGREVTLLDCALLRVAPLALQEELHAFAAAELTD